MWAVLGIGIFSMILGFIWYGPLFGRKWSEMIGVNPDDLEAVKKMQKNAGPLYGVQFLLTMFQMYVLAHFINAWADESGLEVALWIYAAFILTMAAGGSMWNNEPKKMAWRRFLLTAGYHLILFVVAGLVLGHWR